jgi:recombination protein RecT
MKCSPESICKAVLEATQYGLCIGIGGEAYLVPFKGECSFSLSYKGMVKLLLRSGRVSHISAEVVKEGDTFRCIKGMHPDLQHEINIKEENKERPILCVYAIAFLKDGNKPFVCLPNSYVERVRNMSQSYRSKGEYSIWGQHYEEMARKTAIRKLFKYMDYSPIVSEILEKEDAREAGKEPITIDLEEREEEAPTPLSAMIQSNDVDIEARP